MILLTCRHGLDLDQPFDGTIIRLPWRRSMDLHPIAEQHGVRLWDRTSRAELFEKWSQVSTGESLLFLKNVKRIELVEGSPETTAKKTTFERTNTNRTIGNAEIVRIDRNSTSPGSFQSVCTQRYYAIHTFSAIRIAVRLEYVDDVFRPIPEDVGRVFATLPTPILTAFPFHYDAPFRLSSKRRDILLTGEMKEVNNGLLSERSNAFSKMLEVYCPNQADDESVWKRFYCLWWKPNATGVELKAQHSFFSVHDRHQSVTPLRIIAETPLLSILRKFRVPTLHSFPQNLASEFSAWFRPFEAADLAIILRMSFIHLPQTPGFFHVNEVNALYSFLRSAGRSLQGLPLSLSQDNVLHRFKVDAPVYTIRDARLRGIVLKAAPDIGLKLVHSDVRRGLASHYPEAPAGFLRNELRVLCEWFKSKSYQISKTGLTRNDFLSLIDYFIREKVMITRCCLLPLDDNLVVSGVPYGSHRRCLIFHSNLFRNVCFKSAR